jgi:hypothetical protein
MSAKKMLVLVMTKTKAVLGAATRSAGGAPVIEDFVGPGLMVRMKDDEPSLTVPAEELEVKEVDYSDGVFRDPMAHALDESGTISVPSNSVASIAGTNVDVTLTLASPAIAADKNVLVVIDAGPNLDPLKFTGKTVAGSTTVKLPVVGVPPDVHPVFASVEGCASLVGVGNFA